MIELTHDAIEKIVTGVHGFFFAPEAYALATHAKQCDPAGCIVEIGSFQGRSTVVLGTFSPHDVAVYAIDPHQASYGDPYPFGDVDRSLWAQNILLYGLAAKVRPINLEACQVGLIWDKHISLLFIDGPHTYAEVRDELELFLPHVLKGGIVAFHDMPALDQPDPNNGILLAAQERTELESLGEVVTLTGFYRKK